MAPEILDTHGAVSLETAAAMAEQGAALFNSDIAISTTGIAGPGGGSREKPVGTVCFGFHFTGKTETAMKVFPGDRKSVRTRSALFALDYTRRFLRNL